MIILFDLIVLILVALDFIINRCLCSPVFIFGTLWLMICNLSAMRLYGFTGYSEKAVAMIMSGVICFIIGCIIAQLILGNQYKDHKPSNLNLNFTFLNILLFVTCIGVTVQLFVSVKSFLSGASYLEVRGDMLGYTDTAGQSLINSFVSFFCSPAETVLFPIALLCAFRKRRKKFCLFSFYAFLASVVSSGGRLGVLYAIFQVLAVCIFLKVKISKKVKKRVIKIVLICICALFILTNLRSANSIWKSVYQYFTIPIGLFSHYINVLDLANFHSFGGAFVYPMCYLLRLICGFTGSSYSFLDNLVYYVGYPQNVWVGGLFPDSSFNAFCTMFYYFYMDGRVLGIVICSLLAGAACGLIFVLGYRNRNENLFILYLIVIQVLVGSFIIWQFGNTKLFISFFFLFLAFLTSRKRKIKSVVPFE